MTAARSGPTANRIAVLVASPLEASFVERIRSAAPVGVEIQYHPELLPSPRYAADHTGRPPRLKASELAEWLRLLAQADVLFDFDWYEPSRLPQNAPQVRWVQASSAGIGEYLDETGLTSWPVTFTTASGVHSTPLAEFVLLAMLYFAKDVPQLRAWQSSHRWERHATTLLSGQTTLLVGLGNVGRSIASALAAMGVEVWGVRRTGGGSPVPGVAKIISLDAIREVLPRVNALILACPYTKETAGLIGAAELGAMRSSAIVVNVARGQVIDQAALTEALTSRQIRGAVLDVVAEEPLPDTDPLWDLPNVLISPHSASTVPEENGLLVEIFLDNLNRFVRGEPLRNVFNRDRHY